MLEEIKSEGFIAVIFMANLNKNHYQNSDLPNVA